MGQAATRGASTKTDWREISPQHYPFGSSGRYRGVDDLVQTAHCGAIGSTEHERRKALEAYGILQMRATFAPHASCVVGAGAAHL